MKRVRNCDNPRFDWDFFPYPALGIAPAIDAFVMKAHDLDEGRQRLKAAYDRGAIVGVPAHLLPFTARERRALEQNM